MYDSGAVADGTHTLSIAFSGTKNPLSSGCAVEVDAFDVEGTLR